MKGKLLAAVALGEFLAGTPGPAIAAKPLLSDCRKVAFNCQLACADKLSQGGGHPFDNPSTLGWCDFACYDIERACVDQSWASWKKTEQSLVKSWILQKQKAFPQSNMFKAQQPPTSAGTTGTKAPDLRAPVGPGPSGPILKSPGGTFQPIPKSPGGIR